MKVESRCIPEVNRLVSLDNYMRCGSLKVTLSKDKVERDGGRLPGQSLALLCRCKCTGVHIVTTNIQYTGTYNDFLFKHLILCNLMSDFKKNILYLRKEHLFTIWKR